MRLSKKRGFSILEVLIAASLFTIVILGISQSVLLMHRYARANLCKMKAHLLATSYFETLLGDTYPLQFDIKGSALTLKDLETLADKEFKFDKNMLSVSTTNDSLENINIFTTSVYNGDNALTVYIALVVCNSPLYKEYKNTDNTDMARTEINPPEGFQSLRMTYWWTSPFDGGSNAPAAITREYLATLSKEELYAIRLIQPDDPAYI